MVIVLDNPTESLRSIEYSVAESDFVSFELFISVKICGTGLEHLRSDKKVDIGRAVTTQCGIG